jgi:hypothetical protein
MKPGCFIIDEPAIIEGLSRDDRDIIETFFVHAFLMSASCDGFVSLMLKETPMAYSENEMSGLVLTDTRHLRPDTCTRVNIKIDKSSYGLIRRLGEKMSIKM